MLPDHQGTPWRRHEPAGRAGVVVWLLFSLVLAGARASADVDVSSDTTVVLGGTTFDDETIAVDDLTGFAVPWPLGALPPEADLDALHVLSDTESLVSFDSTVTLAGGVVVEPADVVRWDGAGWILEFDASTAGIPVGADLDAYTWVGGLTAVSFDTSVALGAVSVEDEDLVLLAGPSILFDGSKAGVSDGLDLDGAHALPNGNLALSFDGSGSLGGVDFDDEDVLEYDAGSNTWTLVYDGSLQHADWGASDVDAVYVPEPGVRSGLAAGIALLLGLRRRRARRTRTRSRSRAERRTT